MHANESQEPKSNDDLQQLWQQSIHNESFTFQPDIMIQQLKKDVNKFNKEQYLGSWKTSWFPLGMTLVSSATLIKAIQQDDIMQIGFRGAIIVMFGSLACFNLWAAWKRRKFTDTNQREFLEKNIQHLDWYIKFQERFTPFVALLSLYFILFAFSDFIQMWFCILIAVLATIVVFANRTTTDWGSSDASALRSKLNATLHQLNEQ